jgi:hypothetical protein
MAPLHAAAIIILLRMALWRRAEPWLRLTAVATLAQQGVGLFYAGAGRYYYLTWLLTLLVVAVWVRDEGIGIFRRRFSDFSQRVAQHPTSVAFVRGLDRIGGMIT